MKNSEIAKIIQDALGGRQEQCATHSSEIREVKEDIKDLKIDMKVVTDLFTIIKEDILIIKTEKKVYAGIMNFISGIVGAVIALCGEKLLGR